MGVKNVVLKFLFPVLLLTLISSLSLAQASNSPGVSDSDSTTEQTPLTQSEQQFLKDHPVLRFGIDQSWEPYVIRKADGTLEGFEVDILRTINESTGANIQLVTGRWRDLVSQAKNGEIDGLALSVASPDRAEFFNFSDSYFSTYPAIVCAADNPLELDTIDDLKGKSIAFLAGNEFYRNLFSLYPGINIIEAPTEAEAIRMVVEKKATAAAIDTTSFNKYSIRFARSIRLTHIALNHPLELLYSVRKDAPPLISIINKGLKALTPDIVSRSHEHWFGMAHPNYQSNELALTPQEQAWINRNHTIRVHIDNYLPYYSASPDNETKGLAIDYLNLISEKTGLRFQFITHLSWTEALKSISEQDGIDLLPAAYVTEERKKRLVFTDEYLTSPSVILNRENSPFISSINDLSGKIIAAEEGYATTRWLAKNYPAIRLLKVRTTPEALLAVSSGKADAFIGNLIVATYISKKQGLSNLKVAAPSPFVTDNNAMAIRKDWPELAGIINKVLATLTPEEHESIRAHWLPPMRYDRGVSKAELFRTAALISISLLAVIGIVVAWNKRLALEVRARQDAETRINRILQTSPIGIGLTVDRKINFINDHFADMLGYSRSELVDQNARFCYASDEEYERVGQIKYAQIRAQGSGNVETVLRRKDGSLLDVYLNTKPIDMNDLSRGVIFSALDISEQKRAKEELAIERSHLQTIINAVPDLIWLKDVDGKYLSCNKRFEDFFGASEKEISGKTDYDFVDKGLADSFREHDNKAMLAGKPSTNEEVVTFASDGHTEHLETVKTPMHGANGELVGVLGVARNIIERKISEEKLNALKLQAEELSEERGTLLKEIHHRVKNNLQVITSMLSLQKRRTASAETDQALSDAQRRIGIIANAHQKLYETDQLALLNVRSFFHSVIDAIAETSVRGPNITLNKEIGDFEVSFDQATAMAQILGELISNAYKHSFVGRKDGNIDISVNKNNDVIFLQVKDNGVGFDYEKTILKESALGLRLVSAFTEKLNGKVTFHRENGMDITLQIQMET